MTGYQEVLTDPSYTGQIVTMTYPLIGNYGTTARRPGVDARAGRRVRRPRTHPRAEQLPLHQRPRHYLKASNVTGIEGIDTRGLVRRLRVRGAMNGVLSTTDLDDASLVAKARAFPGMVGRDLVSEVVPPTRVRRGSKGFGAFAGPRPAVARRATKHVVALDYGMKWNILRCLDAGRLQGDGRARHRDGAKSADRTTRTASSCRTAPATRPRWATPSTP